MAVLARPRGSFPRCTKLPAEGRQFLKYARAEESDALGGEGGRHFLQGAGQTRGGAARFRAGLWAVGLRG